MKTNLFNTDDRAVSPVIGVILMVAITVILAAVIGTFVLGLGDQLGDSAPQASFTTNNSASINGTSENTVDFEMTKTGGGDVDPSDIVLIVNGDRIDTVNSTDTAGVADPWQTGTTATFRSVGSDIEDGDSVEIRLVHDPSGNSVFRGTITART